MDKYEIAEIFREIARILDFLDESSFRSIAYIKAAKTIESTSHLEELVGSRQLSTLPGIGIEISKMIIRLFNNEQFSYLEELRTKIPESVFEMLAVPRLGKRKVKFLYQEYHIKSLDELEEALKKGIIPRFKNETISRLLKDIRKLKLEGRRVLWQEGMKIAQSLRNKLYPKVIEIVGQLRRKLEIISHIELMVEHAEFDIFDLFAKHSFVKEVTYKQNSKIRVRLKQGITAELKIIKHENWPFALLCGTGSKEHLKDLKKEAATLGMPFHQKTFKNAIDERDIYEMLNLEYIFPELREGMGEVRSAKENTLPKLINQEDIRGVFHCHTLDSDGNSSIEEMALLAQAMGWEYIGISDHSKSSTQAGGLCIERLFQQIETIKSLNKKLTSFKIFTGIECDILRNGDLDFSDDILKYLDFVIVSVHSLFYLSKEEMTNRIIKAVENPYTTMIGHLSGRLLRHRDPYKINIHKIIDACAQNHKVIELNSSPSRLDMDWRYWHLAKEKGVKCSINPDAHRLEDFQNYKLGVNCARKGWLEKNDVINTYPLKKIKDFLKVENFSS